MAGFPRAWLDELRDRADIVQVVSRYVHLSPKGGRYWGLCPFHGEKTASFSVNPQRQMYYCFGCHAGGGAINFLMEIEHQEFHEAVRQLADILHMEVPEQKGGGDGLSSTERERLYEANRLCARFYHSQLWLPENAESLNYLYGRGLDDMTIRQFGLGATPAQGGAATRMLMDKGFTKEELIRCGISVERNGSVYDMFRQRVIFPIIDARGRVLGFGGRTMTDRPPKYLNTGDTPIFNKRKGVFAANLLVKQRGLRRIILTEGYMDVVSLVKAGVTGVCATLGTALTIEQARLLKRYAPEIWVSYDGDSAGQHAILRALEIFEQEDVPCRVLDFPDKMDPDEFVRAYGSEGFDSLRPLEPAEYRMKLEREKHDLSTVDGRTAYAIACSGFLTKVKEPVRLENYLRVLMKESGFERDTLLAQIGRTELIHEEKRPVYERSARPLVENREGVDTETATAERTLLILLVEGKLDPGMISEADFMNSERAELAKRLLAGEKGAEILESIADQEERSRAADIFNRESGMQADQVLQVVGDCLKILRKKRIEQEILSLTAAAKTLDGEEKRQALQRILELTKQKQTAGRKE